MHLLASLSSIDFSNIDFSAVNWGDAFSRLHPLLLHMPIGLIVVLAVLEFPRLFRRSAPEHDSSRSVLVTLLAITAPLTATAGWLLHESADYGPPVTWHEWLGVTLAFLSIGIAIAYWRKSENYTLGVFTAFLVLLPTAHLGATLTHGSDFLTEPWEAALAGGETDEPSADVELDGEAETPDPSPEVPAALPIAPLAQEDESPPAALQDEAPLADAIPVAVTPVAAETVTYGDIAPILKQYCTKCHGERKRKEKLALHTLDFILAGGEHGAVLIPGDPNGSKLITALNAALETDEHMPPEGKPQPSADAIELLTLWVAGMQPVATGGVGLPVEPATIDKSSSRATGEEVPKVEVPGEEGPKEPTFRIFDGLDFGLEYQRLPSYVPFQLDSSLTPQEQADRYTAHARQLDEPILASGLRTQPTIPATTNFANNASSAAAVQALKAHQVNVESIDEQSNLLRIDFTAAALGSETISSLIAPLAGVIGELCLYRQNPTVHDLTLVGMLPNLTDLDLRSLDLTGNFIKFLFINPLQASTSIKSINLSSTPLAGGRYYSLAVLESLERVHVWNAGIPTADLKKLAQHRPQLQIISNISAPGAALETEPEVVFVKHKEPVEVDPDPEAIADEAVDVKTTPENTVCPVSGKPVLPAFTLTHEGRTIGFCCANCPKSFIADPAKYLSILDAK